MSKKSIVSISIMIFVLALSALGFASAQDHSDNSQPFLGVGIEPDQAGALIDQIMPDSPADSAGLQVGDIITAVNGSDVTSETLASAIQALNVGDNVTLNILRGGETLNLEAALAARPQEMMINPAITAQPYLGITLEDSDNGVMIREVAPQSPAADAGLQADDVIVSIDGTDVTTNEEVVSAIQALNAGDTVSLEIERGDETLTIEVTLASRVEANLGNVPGMLNFGITYNANTRQWEINNLSEDSDLYTAGLRGGDVITAFDGNTLDPAALADYLEDMAADQNVTLTVERDGESMELTVTADALKSLGGFQLGIGQLFGGDGVPFDLPFTMSGMGQLGVQFQTLDAQTAADKNITVTDGALVTEVKAGSPAETAGLQVNDVITAVDGDKVDAEHTLRDRLFAYEPGDVIKLDVLRNDETISLEATLAQPEMNGDMLPFNLEQLMPFFGPDGGFQFELPQPPASAPTAPNI